MEWVNFKKGKTAIELEHCDLRQEDLKKLEDKMRELNYAYHHEQGGFELDYGEIKYIFALKYE